MSFECRITKTRIQTNTQNTYLIITCSSAPSFPTFTRQCCVIHTLTVLFAASNEHQQTAIHFTLASQQRSHYAFTWFCNFDACHSNVFCGHNSSSGGARNWSFVQQDSITVSSCLQCSLFVNLSEFSFFVACLTSEHFCANINGRQRVKVWDGLPVTLVSCQSGAGFEPRSKERLHSLFNLMFF